MGAVKIAAIVLIVAGALGLVYRTFTYTSETHTAKLGALELTVKDRETIDVPVWLGAGALAVGGLLLFAFKRRS
jgi:TRAP-type C4-dicarboxylate transport system permease small subunit